MNKIESIVYNAVKSNPKLKKKIRNFYQAAFDLLPRKKNFSINPIILKEGYFYGFHDTNPFSKDNSKILANELYFDFRLPTKEENLGVGYINFDGKSLNKFCKLGETRAWNLHKGCRLQWINNEEVIFNWVDEKDVLKAKIVNVNTKESKVINYPIDTISADGQLASSFSYGRLEKYMPGYGYAIGDDYSFLNEKSSDKTGMYLIDLETHKRIMIISLDELIVNTKNEEGSIEGYHYVTHSEFSPDGKYLSFMHRWITDLENTSKRYSKLVVYNLENKTYKYAPTDNMVSHYDWNQNNEIIAYCRYKGVDSHVLLTIENFVKSKRIAYPRLNSDGHQSFVSNEIFITDTYPNNWRMAFLYIVNSVNDDVSKIVGVNSKKEFQSNSRDGHIACDLHPIVSRDGKYVCFDTVHTGKRALAVMSLEKNE